MEILALVLLLALVKAHAIEKKIELQDIEEDNLRNEQAKEAENNGFKSQEPDMNDPRFNELKERILQQLYSQISPQNYAQQYSVSPSSLYFAPVPLQIAYTTSTHSSVPHRYQGIPYASGSIKTPAIMYQTIAEDHNNIMIDTATGKYYHQPQYQPQFTYVTLSPHSAILPTAIPVSVQTEKAPIPVPVLANTHDQRIYYATPPQIAQSSDHVAYTHVNLEPHHLPVREGVDVKPVQEEDYQLQNDSPKEVHKQFKVQTYKTKKVTVPKLLQVKPIYRSKVPVPHEIPYMKFYTSKRPTLLDSYVPSLMQVEYMKRGYGNDPLKVYDTMRSVMETMRTSSGTTQPATRKYERGFLPNQMYPTGAGGILYGHYKRNMAVPTTKTIFKSD